MARRWAVNVGLLLASVVLFLAAFEGLLRSGALDDFSIHWIPPRYKALDEGIMRPSDERTRRNPLKFNVPIVSNQKGGDVKSRIMVLGDSFIWGFGLPYEQGLGRKLQRAVAQAAPGVEVLAFGRPGWATLHEVGFLENEARAYGMFEADFVLIAFVVNDLDLLDDAWRNYRKKIDWNNAALRAIGKVVPYTLGFVAGHADAAMEVLTDDHGEANWMKRLWSDANLAGYRRVLARLKAALDAAKVPFAVALMPANPNVDYYRPKFELMAAMLKDLGIAHVDLLPGVVAACKGRDMGRNYRLLWANPADAHPGDAMTTALAEGTLDYLKRQGILERLARQEPLPPTERFARLPACDNDRGIVLDVGRFDEYAIDGGETMLRVQGVGFEAEGAAARPLKDVYVLIGEEYFPALPRLPLQARRPDGGTISLNGYFAIDVPAARPREAALREVVGVAERGCVVFRPLGRPVPPARAVPPALDKPPVLQLER